MMDVNLSRSITEVLEIQDTSYIPKLDYTKNLQNCAISKETKGLLGIMYLKYWSIEEQKKEYLQILENNQKRHQAEINEKYNPDNLFKNKEKNKEKVEENTQMIEYKENVFRKILNRIKLFLKIK